MARIKVTIEDLQKDKVYYFDTGSQARGVFEKTDVEDNFITARFRPISKGVYTTTNGLVCFKSTVSDPDVFYIKE